MKIGEASDGVSALAAIRDLSPDLVFLDLEMPGPPREYGETTTSGMRKLSSK